MRLYVRYNSGNRGRYDKTAYFIARQPAQLVTLAATRTGLLVCQRARDILFVRRRHFLLAWLEGEVGQPWKVGIWPHNHGAWSAIRDTLSLPPLAPIIPPPRVCGRSKQPLPLPPRSCLLRAFHRPKYPQTLDESFCLTGLCLRVRDANPGMVM